MCNVNMSEADACEDCALKCLLIHKKKRDPSSIVSSFFKVMIDDRFLEFLPVPPRFAPRLASFAGQEMRVEDSSGRKWTVTLSNVNSCLGFERGWHDFSLDHGIELGDIVIVHFILGSHFVVQIFGRSGCEKLNLPSENNNIPNKRIRTTKDPVARDGSCDISGKGSTPSDMGLRRSLRAHLDGKKKKKKKKEENHQSGVSKKGCLEEPILMRVNRDIPLAGENERSTLSDMLAPEISNIKSGGKVDNVQKGKGLSNVKDRTDNRIAVEAVLKETLDAKMDETNVNGSGTSKGNGDSETSIPKLESAINLEIPEQLYTGCSKDKDMSDYDTLDVEMRETSKPLQVTTDLPSTTLNGMKHNIRVKHIPFKRRARITTYGRQVDGNDGISGLEEPAPAIDGSKSMKIGPKRDAYRIRATIPVTKCTGTQSVKTVKKEHKEQLGSGLKTNITSTNEVGRTVKEEPVSPLEVTCLVKPDSKSSLVIPKGLPCRKFNDKGKTEEKGVLLRDPGGRLWPVIYQVKEDGFKALLNGWESFRNANQIQCGDHCIFSLGDAKNERLYRVQIVHK